MDTSPTLQMLFHAIQRDGQSWQGVNLLYANPCPESTSDHSLNIPVNKKDGILLGVKELSHNILQQDIALYVKDIAAQKDAVLRFFESVLNMEQTETQLEIPVINTSDPTFLIVEDDAMTSKLVASQLQKYGKVVVSKNARQAIANYNVHRPNIIFLDIHYQDDIYDGFDVLVNIRSVHADAFIVMFSADRNPETILKVLSLGANGFIAKPFQSSHFLHYLSMVGLANK